PLQLHSSPTRRSSDLFVTKATAPIAAFKAGSARLGFSFRLTYWDGQFAGWATADEQEDVEYDYEQAPAAQGIPQEVINDFQLDRSEEHTSELQSRENL